MKPWANNCTLKKQFLPCRLSLTQSSTLRIATTPWKPSVTNSYYRNTVTINVIIASTTTAEKEAPKNTHTASTTGPPQPASVGGSRRFLPSGQVEETVDDSASQHQQSSSHIASPFFLPYLKNFLGAWGRRGFLAPKDLQHRPHQTPPTFFMSM